MTTDEALAIAAEHGWALVPVAVMPTIAFRAWAEVWATSPPRPAPVARWWIVVKTDECVGCDEEGNITDAIFDGSPQWERIEQAPEGDSLAPTIVEAVQKMLAQESGVTVTPPPASARASTVDPTVTTGKPEEK